MESFYWARRGLEAENSRALSRVFYGPSFFFTATRAFP
jgi:hypothetical protein